MTYPQFSQVLRGLHGERIRQAFHHFDKDCNGYIEPEDFQRIMVETSKHKLLKRLDNLPAQCNIPAGSKISYASQRQAKIANFKKLYEMNKTLATKVQGLSAFLLRIH
jgi:solute carrier family 25 aspartate/glutamate transporter 12/13